DQEILGALGAELGVDPPDLAGDGAGLGAVELDRLDVDHVAHAPDDPVTERASGPAEHATVRARLQPDGLVDRVDRHRADLEQVETRDVIARRGLGVAEIEGELDLDVAAEAALEEAEELVEGGG